jgi:hypothetical protein
MFSLFKKLALACTLILVVFTTGAWQGNHVVLAESQNVNIPETPLYPGLTWSRLGPSTRDITLNVKGDTISLSGAGYEAAEQFVSSPSQDVLNYYSNEQLAKSGWDSYDAFQRSDGVHYVFYHESGVYLSVEFLKCPDVPSSICVTVWKSQQTNLIAATPDKTSEPGYSMATGSFGKISPADGATKLNPTSTVLSWGIYSPTPDKYSYCVKEGSACGANDPQWTGTNTNTSVTLTDLSYDKTYYWQVKAITCATCIPKTFVYADNGTVWTFKTKPATQATILGNAGVAGAILSYTDGTLKTVTADGTGAYSITVPLNWSGTVTPAKSGYLFSPKSASFSNLTAPQTIQNFTAIVAYVISGNVGISGVTLSYTDGTPQTVMSDSSGNYSLMVPSNWSGIVTPSKVGNTFLPTSRNYSNVTTNQTAQNYSVLATISGNAGIGGVTLSYTDGTLKTVIADGSGNYSLVVSYNWSGMVTPSKTGYTFSPPSRTYSNVITDQTGQNYTALLAITGNTGVAGVTLTYTDGSPQFVTADGSGNYSLNVPSGWSGAVTPHKIGYSFTPASKSYSNVLSNQTGQNYTAAVCATCADKDTTGVFRPSNGLLYLKNLNITGFADVAINYGLGGDYPVVGDWNGDGTATIGIYRSGSFYLRNSNTIGFADLVFAFGTPGDQPIAGDWDGNGTDTIGVYRPSTGQFLLRNSNTSGAPDMSFYLGNVGDVGIAGDWDGDGKDTTGVFRPSNGVIFLKNANSTGFADVALNYGLPGDQPVTGDWNNDGKDTIGVYRNGVFYLRNSNTIGFADLVFGLGNPGDMPIAGDWDAKP